MPSAALRRVADDYWEGVLRRNPILATFLGDYRYNDRLPDIGPHGRAEEESDLRGALAHLEVVERAEALDVDDQITASMLRLSAQAALDAVRLRLDEMAVDQMDGPQVWLPELLNWHPTGTTEHVQQLVARYQAFPVFIDQYLENLADGIRSGRTAPVIAVERVIAQLEALLDTAPEESPLAHPSRLAAPELRGDLPALVSKVVYPAYQRLLAFLAGEDGYLRRYARAEPGVWAVTDGEEIYALLARQHTTTDLSPTDLHEIGREDLATIHAEMRVIMREQGATEPAIRAFAERLTRDPANLPRTREEILASSERLLGQALAALPRAFGRLPRTPCVVKPVEDFRERDAPAAYYFPPSADGSRPGTFYVNTFEPSARPRHTLPALAFHEGVPGHHLQIALAQETEGLPAFRRYGAGWLSNAFVEGWALYTERLADELGLYPDGRARFGMLGYQAWRACRLVVDTGIHHYRWSRQQAIDFFFDNVGLSDRETINEVDRYIVWPAQALAYKIGQREIERVRHERERQLGEGFDLRRFHDALLSHAAVPLSSLRLIVTAS
ncbi:MAG: DUF885 domain-containing protein [Chloroflexota bacterium]|nr:DUF885 domain-containing protein [Chloroflexota bacterium]